jgi:hypothetical protein
MFKTVWDRWRALMSGSALTLLGAVAAHFLIPVRKVEYILFATSVIFAFRAMGLSWIDERKKLISATKAHLAEQAKWEKERDQFINYHRPEVFAEYAVDPPLTFLEMFDDWDASEGSFLCDGGIRLLNRGKSVAYHVQVAPIALEGLCIEFDSIPVLEVDKMLTVNASVHYTSLQFQSRNHLPVLHLLDHGKSSVTCEAKDTSYGRSIIVSAGLALTVTWKDSSGHYFEAVSRTSDKTSGEQDSLFGDVKRIPAPMTEDEKQDILEEMYQEHPEEYQ